MSRLKVETGSWAALTMGWGPVVAVSLGMVLGAGLGAVPAVSVWPDCCALWEAGAAAGWDWAAVEELRDCEGALVGWLWAAGAAGCSWEAGAGAAAGAELVCGSAAGAWGAEAPQAALNSRNAAPTLAATVFISRCPGFLFGSVVVCWVILSII